MSANGNTLSASEVLAERLSDRLLSRSSGDGHDERMDAFFQAGRIAILAVMRAGEAGNVQCKDATLEIMPYLNLILKK